MINGRVLGLVPPEFVAVAVTVLLPTWMTPRANVVVNTPCDPVTTTSVVPLIWKVTVVPGSESEVTVSVGVRSPVKLSVADRPVSVGSQPGTNLPLPPTKAVSEMTWTTDDNRVQKLSDMMGKAVILDFWAT